MTEGCCVLYILADRQAGRQKGSRTEEPHIEKNRKTSGKYYLYYKYMYHQILFSGGNESIHANFSFFINHCMVKEIK